MKTSTFPALSMCLAFICGGLTTANEPKPIDLLTIEDDDVKVGIDRRKGGSITWLSSSEYPKNIVNIADPGRLIQQSYYAGRAIDRTSDGQNRAWSPWSWNPIQGGGVGSTGDQGSWARVTTFRKDADGLYSETIPKLWDMPDEEASALMRQWTSLEPNMTGVVCVQCEFQTMRKAGDRWGGVTNNPQELPACYFIRNFSDIRSYLGNGEWRSEHQPPGPPWGRTNPPLKAMAMFAASGQGVAIYSPTSGPTWNFGPHGTKPSNRPEDGPCMHVAPIDRVRLSHACTFRYRYWLTVGTESEIAERLDVLRAKYSSETSEITQP